MIYMSKSAYLLLLSLIAVLGLATIVGQIIGERFDELPTTAMLFVSAIVGTLASPKGSSNI